MKLKDVAIGQTYGCKVSGNRVRVKVLKIEEKTNWNGRTLHRITCINLATKREIVRSAAALHPLVIGSLSIGSNGGLVAETAAPKLHSAWVDYGH